MNSYANREDLDWFLTNFRIDFQKPLPTFTDKLIDGGQNLQDPPAKHGVEANLDIQYTVGIATGVPIEFVSSGDSSVKGVVKMVNALLSETTVPTVLSFSYAFDEDFVTPRDAESLCDLFMQLGSRGTSVIIASGDGGVAGRSPKETCRVTNNGLFNRSGRAFPDVAAQGKSIAIALNGKESSVYGTSASAPIFASVIALLNDRLLTKSNKAMGFLNPFLYANPGILNDITEGSNPSCKTAGFPAKTGWDPVTGLGTPKFASIANTIGV
ncbi:hypothetical protein BG003_009647 [Podila horticola]|nr:hypothetical protein BG003_009647 [Podila horticola]